MKLVKVDISGTAHWGVWDDPERIDLLPDSFVPTPDLGQLNHLPASIRSIRRQEASLLAPVLRPPKVICIGKNYADHASEMGGESPELPIVFSKFSSAVVGPDTLVRLPAISQQVDFEAELVVVIGRPGKHIRREHAWDHVMGYTCGNDVSSRDWQKGRPGGQWLLGKTFDTFAPVGPSLVTPQEIPDPSQLDIQLTLNGELMQSSNTRLMLYPIDYLISHLSQFFALETGDLIFTGTPAGVGAGRTPAVFLKPGDETEVQISHLGCLRTRYVADDEAAEVD